eukprot:239999-Rhodomonas_salina.2
MDYTLIHGSHCCVALTLMLVMIVVVVDDDTQCDGGSESLLIRALSGVGLLETAWGHSTARRSQEQQPAGIALPRAALLLCAMQCCDTPTHPSLFYHSPLFSIMKRKAVL